VAKWRAALPMYDLPSLASAHQALWTAMVTYLHREGHAHLPATLETITDPYAFWRDPQVLFSQCCEYPLLLGLQTQLEMLASPHYDCVGCEGARYSSYIVARADDPRRTLVDYYQSCVAINDVQSNSGYNLLAAAVAELGARNPFFKNHVVSGSHLQSLLAVKRQSADLAAVDCVSFTQLKRAHLINPADYQILAHTSQAGALPWVCSKSVPADLQHSLKAALQAALTDPHLTQTRQALLLKGADFSPDTQMGLTRLAHAKAITIRLTPTV
jgi:ABC-type phosphate/phosphonate transport system substrate-binding protein